MTNQSIYTVGGTVQAGGGIYIPRKADNELLELCRAGEYAFILSSRQVGKSSLMVRTAQQLGEELFALRGKTFNIPLGLKDGINRALEPGNTPLLVADISDNPGGGAPGDSTFILRELLQGQAEQTCLGPIWDPMAVRTAFSAGIGARLAMRIGGKSGITSGQPLDVDAEITALCPDAYQSFEGTPDGLGDCAAIRVAGVDIVLTSLRNQALGLELFTNLGIDPASYRVVVVKSSQHFRHEFGPIAAETIYVDSPGTLSQDYDSIPYTKLDRPMWPLVEDPFALTN